MKRIAKIVSVNLAILIAGLFLCELIFGNWIFGPDYRELNIPRNTVRSFDVSNLYEADGNITYSRDKNGLRGQYEDVGSIDVLTLGGSTTNQLYVDDAKTWHAVMQRAFEDAGRNVSIVNAGVDGQSTRGHIAVFERWFPLIKGLRARFILVYAGVNDVALQYAEQYDDMRSPDSSRRLAASIKNKSAVYELYGTVRGMFAAYRSNVVHGADWKPVDAWQPWRPVKKRESVDAVYRPRLQAYAKRLNRLAAEIRDFGARPVFVTQPSAEFRIENGWVVLPAGGRRNAARNRYLELDAFNRTSMEVCRDLEALCIDLADDLSFEDGDFYDRVHNTASGAAKIGAYLFEKMRQYL